MKRLKELAAKARKELRNLNRDAKLPQTRAFANYFNKMSQTAGFGSREKFGHEYWVKVAQKMGEDTEKIGDDLLFWVAGMAGIISLLPLSTQSILERKELERIALSFFDAIDFVG